MNRRMLLALPLGVALMLAMLAGACSKVEPGYVGVKVNKFGSDKGVEDSVLSTGYYWVGFTWSIYSYPVFQQNMLWAQSPHEGKKYDQSINFQSREGMTLNADVGCVFTIDPTKVPVLFQRFRQGMDDIADSYLRQLVRDVMNREASVHPIESLYGDGRPAFIKAVQKVVAEEVRPLGIIIHNITIGTLRLPPSVLAAVDAKIAATQKAIQTENEVRQAQAEAKKKVAEAEGDAAATLARARAQAQANQLLSASLSPTLVEYERVRRWDGKLPMVQGGASPFISLPFEGKK